MNISVHSEERWFGFPFISWFLNVPDLSTSVRTLDTLLTFRSWVTVGTGPVKYRYLTILIFTAEQSIHITYLISPNTLRGPWQELSWSKPRKKRSRRVHQSDVATEAVPNAGKFQSDKATTERTPRVWVVSPGKIFRWKKPVFFRVIFVDELEVQSVSTYYHTPYCTTSQ